MDSESKKKRHCQKTVRKNTIEDQRRERSRPLLLYNNTMIIILRGAHGPCSLQAPCASCILLSSSAISVNASETFWITV